MPLTEMPLEQLKEYQGCNPRPADFDEYWDKALAELRTVDARIELRPAAFAPLGADCFDLYFTGVGGARIHAKYLRPKVITEPHPAVLIFHGYQGSSGDWADKLAHVAEGRCVAALDCRGQAGESEDVGGEIYEAYRGHVIRGLYEALQGQPEALLFRQIFLDTLQLAHIVMALPEVDENRVAAVGGSQGGGLSLACAALEPRIKKAAPTFPGMCDYQRLYEMGLADDLEEVQAFFGGTDPLHQRESEIFTALGYIDNQFLAGRIRAEVLMLVGMLDTTCPPSSQFAAYNKITAKKGFVIYPDHGHQFLPGASDRVFSFLSDL